MGAFSLRARVFFPVFVIACIASLAWVFSRPAVYQSSARLQIEAAEDSPNLLTAAQNLTSRGLVDGVARRLNRSDIDALQGMLSAIPAPGTNVIELRAEGGERELLPRILGAWIDVYRQSNVEAKDQSSAAALNDARAAADQLQQSLAAARREIEAYRRKFDIVSIERDENQSMARLKGLNTAANEARSREINAEARVNAMRENIAAGRSVRPPGDKAIIADLEKRALDLRDKMKDLEQDFTPAYLALDSKYKALRANLTRLEQQIEREQQVSADQALQGAEEELTSARQAVLRLQKDLAARKQEAQEFTTRFAEHGALVNELARLEESYNAGKERVAQLEAEKRTAGPKVSLLGQPSIPDHALRPDYGRDALIGIAGSVALGLLAVWFVEFFRRSGAPQPAPALQPIIQIAIGPGSAPDALTLVGAAPTLRLQETVARPVRALSDPEVDALLAAASPEIRPVIAALLSGRPPQPLAGPQGAAPPGGDLEALLARAARDAGLSDPGEVTVDTLRQTYLAYLVRQGAR